MRIGVVQKNGPRYEHRDPRRETVYSFCRLWVWQCFEKENKVNINKPWPIDCLVTEAKRLLSSPTDTWKDKTIVYPRVRSARQTDSHRVPKCNRVVLTECEPSVNRASVASQRASRVKETTELALWFPPIPHIIASLFASHARTHTTQVRFATLGLWPPSPPPPDQQQTSAMQRASHPHQCQKLPMKPVPDCAITRWPYPGVANCTNNVKILYIKN